MMKIRIYDSQFAHTTALGCGDLVIYPKEFHWTRQEDQDRKDIAVISESFFSEVNNIPVQHKIGLLIEPVSISPDPYRWVLHPDFHNKFDFIFTHNQALIDYNPAKFKFYPFMGCWIKQADRKMHAKFSAREKFTQNVSMIVSGKKDTVGHRLRHDVLERLNKKYPISVFGRGTAHPVDYKLEALAPYPFSIVIENEKSQHWFTEKICDCFATGTVPIYWGAPTIGRFFDEAGIIQFDTIEQLEDILENLTIDDYYSRIQSVEKNLAKDAEFEFLPDNYIFSYIKNYYNL